MEVSNGQLTLKIAETGKEYALDLVMAKLASEQVEERHVPESGEWRTTPEFLADLANAYGEVLKIEDCSPSMAYALWNEVATLWESQKKSKPQRRK